MCRGAVESVNVDNILLDTGCSGTLVRRELVKLEKFKEGKLVEIQCAHGNTTSYPIAKVDLVVEERDITVEPAVSDTLPQSVLLGVDVPELEDFMVHNRKESDGSAFVVTTRTSAKRERSRKKKSRERGMKRVK